VSRLLAGLAERMRFPVRLTLAEADVLAAAAGQYRGKNRDLDSAVTRVRRAAGRKRASVARIARLA